MDGTMICPRTSYLVGKGGWRTQLSALNVRTCTKSMGFGKVKCAQLHHFANASEGGSGTATYIHIVNQQNNIHITSLLGKARVTPLKTVTIPQLELTAAVLAVRVESVLKAELVVQEDSVFWTDSTSVLKYFNNEDRHFHTFVANRISTISETSEPSQWRHVRSKDNPADDASQGVKVVFCEGLFEQPQMAGRTCISLET